MIERYETEAMRALFSDEARLQRYTDVEVAACKVAFARGEIPADDWQAIETKARAPSPARVSEIELQTQHDLVAFVRALGELVGPASRHIHRGLTSSDVIDTAQALTLRAALAVVVEATGELRHALGERAREHKLTLCAGRTHGIHAEPTTFGLRLAGFYAELGRDLERLESARAQISFGKLSGAVGTFSQTDPEFEHDVLAHLGLAPEPIATQVVPRDRHAQVMATLAILGGALERLAVDIRSLQRTDVREAEEPFREGQTGSSAMPHKRNPVVSERVCGMARLLRGYAAAELESMALWHERDISHSSVERVALPDAFHLAHTMVLLMTKLVRGLRVYPEAMKKNMERAGGLVFSQSALGVLLDAGLDRTAAYSLIQKNAMAVWEGKATSLEAALLADADVHKALGGSLQQPNVAAGRLAPAFDPARYTRHVDALFRRAGL